MFGTFALVFVAAGADTTATVSGDAVSGPARAIAPALMVSALIYAFGDVSGAHVNPAVTFAFAAKRLFPLRWVMPYWIAQLAGAILAAIVLHLLFGAAADAGVSTPHDMSAASATALESLLTILLVAVILGTTDRARIVGPDAALAVGATIALCGLIAGPIEGASMNPARSLGPALVGARLADAWIYVVGPFFGALVATVLSRLLHGRTEDDRSARDAAQGG